MSQTKSLIAGAGTSDQNFRDALQKVQDNLVDVVLNSGALAVGTTKPQVKIANTIRAMANGTLLVKTTADHVLPVSTVTNALFNVFVVTIDSAGAVTVTAGTQGATLAAVVFPTIPANQAVVGFFTINPTGTGNFVGATTDLDDATVVPNAVFVDTPYPFNTNTFVL